MELTLQQKVRVMRRVVRNVMKAEDFAYNDLSAFGAPGECYRDIGKGFDRRIHCAFDSLNLTEEDWFIQMDECGDKESEFFHGEPSPAYYEKIYVRTRELEEEV